MKGICLACIVGKCFFIADERSDTLVVHGKNCGFLPWGKACMNAIIREYFGEKSAWDIFA
jgi:hypothetical protein